MKQFFIIAAVIVVAAIVVLPGVLGVTQEDVQFSNTMVRQNCRDAINERLEFPFTSRYTEVAFYDVWEQEGFKTYVADVVETTDRNATRSLRFGCRVKRDGVMEINEQTD